jgi:ribosomal-protein-alanine N-acetyltransferase
MTLWQPPLLETPRLRLRPLTAADAPAVFMYASNPRMTAYTLWETHASIDDTLWFVSEYAYSRYANAEPDPLGIIRKDDPLGTVIGSVGGFWVSQSNAVMELGYSVAEPYWGRGIAVEASRVLLDYLFEQYPITRLQARVFVGNDASERVLQKLGFTREGVLRALLVRRQRTHDIAYYSLLRREWERRAT